MPQTRKIKNKKGRSPKDKMGSTGQMAMGKKKGYQK
jgi:hypothetical protein